MAAQPYPHQLHHRRDLTRRGVLARMPGCGRDDPGTPPAGLASCLTLHGPVQGFLKPPSSSGGRAGWLGSDGLCVDEETEVPGRSGSLGAVMGASHPVSPPVLCRQSREADRGPHLLPQGGLHPSLQGRPGVACDGPDLVQAIGSSGLTLS